MGNKGSLPLEAVDGFSTEEVSRLEKRFKKLDLDQNGTIRFAVCPLYLVQILWSLRIVNSFLFDTHSNTQYIVCIQEMFRQKWAVKSYSRNIECSCLTHLADFIAFRHGYVIGWFLIKRCAPIWCSAVFFCFWFIQGICLLRMSPVFAIKIAKTLFQPIDDVLNLEIAII